MIEVIEVDTEQILAKKMKDDEGKKVFDKDEWISAHQIASYFSRCTYQKSVKVQVIETEEDEDLNEIIQQVQEIEHGRNLTLLRHEVLELLQGNCSYFNNI
ncbi:Hypothetical predicted protein [Mytilus galloprovincialis]|uniref:Uncharacterized protein n=1 Tax=Mytilus galloprovincialis TaxID=29158 RepID=A0A8B6CHM0_MYTGA|nr:Hypothetical predicted protein [Mytilus galloprovincialis]